jgi:ribosomal-protein-alanine N-acetyltransferase
MSRPQRVAEIERDEYAIVRMTEHDLLEVVEIEEACRLSLWGWDAYMAELYRPEAVMLVARQLRPEALTGRSVRGFIAARVVSEELHVNNVGVREEVRRCGVGSALLGAALARGACQGARGAVLEVRFSNSAAQALYRRHGFRTTGQRRNYYREPTEDALVMCLTFSP